MARAKKKTRRARKQAIQHLLSMALVSCVIVVLAVTLSVASISLHKKNQKYKAQQAELEKQLQNEEMRAEEIEELDDYVGTKDYIEDVAKDKLGLVYPNEILFEAEQ